MGFKIIATWRMAYESLQILANKNKKELSFADGLIEAISYIEDYPYYKSVGYGGLPNENGVVECDAGFMDGQTLAVGAIGAVKNVKNPIKLAYLLSQERFNSFLVSEGAEKYAIKNNLEFVNMLTPRAKKIWEKKLAEVQIKNISPYDGHDTVGMVCLDNSQKMGVATSTSGLFFKHEGRLGDSPLTGSGFYCDQELGGACATGLGEDIMKGNLSYAIVQSMIKPIYIQKVCDEVLFTFEKKLLTKYGKAGAMSVIAMNNKGQWAISTNVDFSFVILEDDQVNVYIASPDLSHQQTKFEKASQQFLMDYMNQIKQPL